VCVLETHKWVQKPVEEEEEDDDDMWVIYEDLLKLINVAGV
jgi:hypothetical protein